MPAPQAKFPGRHDELPAVAQFLSSSFNRDLTLFTDYSPDFGAPYPADFTGLITSVTGIVFPDKLTKEGKLVTARIVASLDRLKVLNKLTESYVKRAGDALTVSPTDFGCRVLRRSLNRGDVEGIITDLRFVLQNIDANLTALTAKGFKAATRTEMAALPASLTADNTLQNDNIQARNALVNENIALFDRLYAIMRDVSETGKVIHKTISGTPERVADYTIATLLKRVRNERKAQGGEAAPPAGGGG